MYVLHHRIHANFISFGVWTTVCYLKNEFIKLGNKLELQITTKMLGGTGNVVYSQ